MGPGTRSIALAQLWMLLSPKVTVEVVNRVDDRSKSRNQPEREIYLKHGNLFIFSRPNSIYAMSKSIDERGRIYLPKDVRERFGDQYRIVELPSHVALFPVDEDPLDGIRDAVGDAFAETAADELKSDAREAISREVRAEKRDRSQDCAE